MSKGDSVSLDFWWWYGVNGQDSSARKGMAEACTLHLVGVAGLGSCARACHLFGESSDQSLAHLIWDNGTNSIVSYKILCGILLPIATVEMSLVQQDFDHVVALTGL